MPPTRFVPALAVALLVVTAGCAGFVGTAANDAGTGPATASHGDSTVAVGATGTVTAQPDQAIVRLAVVATADTPNAAREAVAANVSEMRSALREMGIADEQVRTIHYDISQDHRREESQPTRYRAIHAFAVTVSDVDRVGPVIDAAVAGGATRVDGVQFTLSDEKRNELRQEALEDAMTNARAQASTVAGQANLSITGVHAVSTVNANVQPYVAERTALAAAQAGGTSIESGPVTVTAQVTVVYNATAS